MEDHPKIYFKGNAITNNNYIPKSALNNRKPKHFLVEMPEGQNYFISSKKKQFSHLHHQSEIKDLSLFQNEEKVHKPNNLDTHDIEGAYANTLQSQALKNRSKVSYFASKKSSQQTPELSWQSLNHENNTKTNPKLNYHIRHKLKTEPPSSEIPKFELGDRRKPFEHFSSRDEEKYRKQTESKLQQLKELEREKNRKIQLELQKYKEKEREEELSRQIAKQEERKKYEEARKKEENSLLQQKRQQNRERINFIKKQQKSREDLTRMWHGDTKKLNLIPYQQIRKWNPTYFPEHYPSPPYRSNETSALHLPKIQ